MYYYIFYYNKNKEVRIKCFDNDLIATKKFVKKKRRECATNIKVKESLNKIYYQNMELGGGIMPIHFVLTEKEFDALQGVDITEQFNPSWFEKLLLFICK